MGWSPDSRQKFWNFFWPKAILSVLSIGYGMKKYSVITFLSALLFTLVSFQYSAPCQKHPDRFGTLLYLYKSVDPPIHDKNFETFFDRNGYSLFYQSVRKWKKYSVMSVSFRSPFHPRKLPTFRNLSETSWPLRNPPSLHGYINGLIPRSTTKILKLFLTETDTLCFINRL